MNKYATFLAVAVLATGFVAVRTSGDLPNTEPVSLQQADLSTQEVQEMLASYRVFKRTLEATIESLRTGQIGLKEAHAHVRETARRYYPKYLGWLSLCEAGSSVTERLARNLVGHVRAIEEIHPTKPSPLPGLEQELCEFLADIDE